MTNNNDLYIYNVTHPQVESAATFYVSSTSEKESKKYLEKEILFHKESPVNGHLYDVKLVAKVINTLLQDVTMRSGVIGATTIEKSKD